MAITLQKGQSRTYSLPAGSVITINASGQALVENFGRGIVLVSTAAVTGAYQIGPYLVDVKLRITSLTLSTVINDIEPDYTLLQSRISSSIDGAILVAGRSAVPVSVIEPATTFTSATPTNGGSNTIVLTSAGAHGLTSAAAVGYPIYISAGTGWTPGFYPITNVAVDTSGTVFTISGTFVTGMGAPTIALANTEVTLASVTIPSLGANSIVRIDKTYYSPNNSSTQKTVRVKLNDKVFTGVNLTTSPNMAKVTVIQNRGATNSQISRITANSATGEGPGTLANVPETGSIDTSVPTTVSFTVIPTAANIPITLERYFVEVFK